MVKSSLGSASASHSKRPATVPASSKSAAVSPTQLILNQITLLSSQLPPTINTANLNPLADLLTLFNELPLTLSEKRNASEEEGGRRVLITSLLALKTIFEALIEKGRMHGILKSSSNKRSKVEEVKEEKEATSVEKVKEWLNSRYQDYCRRLVEIMTGHWDNTIRISAFKTILSLLRTESLFLTSLHHSKQAQFANTTFSVLVKGLLAPDVEDEGVTAGWINDEVREEWRKVFDRYDDLRFYFLKASTSLIKSYTAPASSSMPPPLPTHLAHNLLAILETLTTMPTSAGEIDEWFCSKPLPLAPKIKSISSSKKRKAPSRDPSDTSTGVFDSSSESEAEETVVVSRKTTKLLPPLLSLPAHKKAFQECWMALLTLPLEEGEVKRILGGLHRGVLPHMSEATRLMDWLVDSVDVGGTIGILALNGLFTLMQKHNLDYPDFFTKLYALLDRDLLHVKYRPRFFRLLEIFMSSSHLPSTLVSSFIKRLARLSLSAPPAAIVMIVPFIYNLLKLHPGCMVLIHRARSREDEDNDVVFDMSTDPFNALESDPLHTHAPDSSLWELATLRHHYSASVSGLAKIFGEVMSRQSYAMEDFLDHSYGTLFDTELTRKLRSAPALAPLPARQPIGDSFFPSSLIYPAPITADAVTTIKKKSKILLDDMGEEIGLVEEDEEDEASDRGPVDIVSRLWRF